VWYGQVALRANEARTGPLLVEVYTDRKRLRLNGEVTEENVRKLLEEAEAKELPIDLSYMNLSNLKGTKLFVGRNLRFANLRGITSTQLDFSGGSLFGAILIKAIATKSAFAKTDFSSADAWNADFQYAITFEDATGLDTVQHLGTARFHGAKGLSDASKAIILKANPNMKFGYV
jgi:uncharacterized protein YjbI with pentapeptide repeats